jgi:inner membrane protease ATP23
MCELEVNFVDPWVLYVSKALEEKGCPIPRYLFKCTKCNVPAFSTFYLSPPEDKKSNPDFVIDNPDECIPSIMVCAENNLPSQTKFNKTLVHELIHAYDYCRANIDGRNLEQLACMEVSVCYVIFLIL